jgi:hypothetical protein
MNVEQVPYLFAIMKFCLLMISWFHGDVSSNNWLRYMKMKSLRNRLNFFST